MAVIKTQWLDELLNYLENAKQIINEHPVESDEGTESSVWIYTLSQLQRIIFLTYGEANG